MSNYEEPCIEFPLPGGNALTIRLKRKVTREEFELVKKVYEISEFAFVGDGDEGQAGKGAKTSPPFPPMGSVTVTTAQPMWHGQTPEAQP